MTNDFYQEPVDIEEIEELVTEILRKFHKPYPPDITDQVFLAIEHDPNKRRRYEIFVGQDNKATTNQWIGRLVSEYTGLKAKGVCTEPKSHLIQTYSILGR
jgi:hypothetical protein